VPTPRGPVDVSWEWDTARSRFTLKVAVPAGTSGQVAVPTSGTTSGVRIDGKLVWNGTKAKAPGVSLVDGYVVIDGVGPGTHLVTVRPAT
jgi:hypothetical protein